MTYYTVICCCKYSNIVGRGSKRSEGECASLRYSGQLISGAKVDRKNCIYYSVFAIFTHINRNSAACEWKIFGWPHHEADPPRWPGPRPGDKMADVYAMLRSARANLISRLASACTSKDLVRWVKFICNIRIASVDSLHYNDQKHWHRLSMKTLHGSDWWEIHLLSKIWSLWKMILAR